MELKERLLKKQKEDKGRGRGQGMPDPRVCNELMRERKRKGGQDRRGEPRAERDPVRKPEGTGWEQRDAEQQKAGQMRREGGGN